MCYSLFALSTAVPPQTLNSWNGIIIIISANSKLYFFFLHSNHIKGMGWNPSVNYQKYLGLQLVSPPTGKFVFILSGAQQGAYGGFIRACAGNILSTYRN